MAEPSNLAKRIVFTGGSGVAGRHVVAKLLSYGHKILNVDTTSLDNPDVYTLKADLTDGAQAFNSLSCHFQVSEPFMEPVQTPDAVIHFAGIPQPMRVPDNELFRINTMSSYNIIEAACKLGIKKIILASSITTYGVTYAEGDVDFPHFPLTEESPTQPMDVYATSKLCMERVAESFARRFKGVDIYALRIGGVIEPDRFEEKLKSYIEEPEKWKPHAWSYTDARDLGSMIQCCLAKDGLGFQVFNAVNDEITNVAHRTTERFLKSICPNTPFTREMGPREAPVSNTKIKDMTGFKEEFGWREMLGRES
ncbi:NAD-dependent epimerase/dehydratase-like protein [Trematosphaeria pertusa]|uniref:NAD-dependent epimerase/dehydratase-like protein n=1 Tax=Trematosphaeria pertusa TaxID=390896 RepID=A0A6A6J0P5_9PLEO|nr:NAD-dependent epimerase/dehydratase-like protein [Trematosphaeria pertusa]KAF2255430.1 NAD-dependent epimerase/dehydratase-like protein [Trematosphaeria pertusa]